MATSFIGRDMAVDLGTANTLVYVRGRGVLLDEPSVVALNSRTARSSQWAHEAKRMIGRAPRGITPIRPLKDGVIADFEATEQMLRYFIQKVHRRRYFAKPRMVICVPSGITAVEQRAVKEAGYQAGARKVYIVEEPMAAAIGAGLPVHQATGNMVVDVGGGTTEVAVISPGRHRDQRCPSARRATTSTQRSSTWMKKEYSLMLGERTAEEVKMTLGSAFPLPDEPEAEIRGRDMVSGLPRTVVVSSAEIRQALDEPLHAIVDAVRATLDQTPPELAGDIMDRGIVLTGGGALLRGLDERLRHETGMPVHIAEDPLSSRRLRCGQVRRGVRGAAAGARDRVSEILMSLMERPTIGSFEPVRGVDAPLDDAVAREIPERRWRGGGGSSRKRPPRSASSVAGPLLIALVLACATLMTLDHQADTVLSPYAKVSVSVLGPVEDAAADAIAPVAAVPAMVPHPATTCAPSGGPARRQRRPASGNSPRTHSTAVASVSTTASRPRPSDLGVAMVPARVIARGPAQSLLAHRDDRRRVLAGVARRSHGRQRRRPGRPGAAYDPHHGDRAADPGRRLGR
jgi:rod shape-determining protein MreB